MHHRRRATQVTENGPLNQAAQPSSPSLDAPPSCCRSCRPVASIQCHWPGSPATTLPTEAVGSNRNRHRRGQRRLAARPPPASAAAPAGPQVRRRHTHLERRLQRQPRSWHRRWWGRRGHTQQQLARRVRQQRELPRPRRCPTAQGPQQQGSCWERQLWRPAAVAAAAELLAQSGKTAAGLLCC